MKSIALNRSTRGWRAALLALAAASMLGCASSGAPLPEHGTSLPTVSQTPGAEVPAYRISRGDELNLRFYYTPELNTIATVRSDGRIAVPLLGDMVVEGKTTAELTEQVMSALSSQVRRPQLSINVQGTGSQRVFVGGEVARPGVQPLLGPLTVSQAVMVAEGLKESAGPRDVVLVRRGRDGERSAQRVDLKAVMDGSDLSQDVLLQPYDLVVVPRSGIANVNLWVDQYLRRNLPISLGISYSINRTGVVYP